jgi:uncharacterized membrane protein
MVYRPFTFLFSVLLAFALMLAVSLLFVDVLRTAFTRIGFSWDNALILLLACLLGSMVNIPVARLESKIPLIKERSVRVYGITYRIPVKETVKNYTTIALNLGGAIIPSLVSIYLLLRFPGSFTPAVYATLIVAAVTYMVAKPVPGVGIVTPAFVPPIAAAVSAWLMLLMGADSALVFVIAYAGGTLGTLIGADILNLGKIKNLGAPIASIGGAGTFDGVFLTGIIAVLIV